MAQTSRPGNTDAIGMVKGGELHQGKKHSGDSPGTNRRRHVTAEQKQRIRELYEVTKKGHEVAQIMGIGKTTVYNHLGLKNANRRWTDEEDQAVIDGYAERRPVKEIALEIGRSNRAVILHMHYHRKKIREDPKKRRALSAITMAFKAVRKADIFREVTD